MEASFLNETHQIALEGPLKSPIERCVDIYWCFQKDLLAVPLAKIKRDTLARELTGILFQHSFSAENLFSDYDTSFAFEHMYGLTIVFENQMEHASVKHTQVMELVKGCHGQRRRTSTLKNDEERKAWIKCMQIATFNHNMSYHSALDRISVDSFSWLWTTWPYVLKI